MIRLVVNADDLGMSPGIDEGIFAAHRDGIVTSASILVRGATARAAVARAREAGIALGVHLTLTHLEPAADAREVESVAPSGRLRRSWKEVAAALALGRIRLAEVERELCAQVAFARTLGAEIDHLDGHQHLHLLPGIGAIVLDIARREGLPIRWPGDSPSAEWLLRPGAGLKTFALRALAAIPDEDGAKRVPAVGTFHAGRLDEDALVALLEGLGPGDHELGCHPGLGVGRVDEDPGWDYAWEDETRALTSARARAAVDARGINLVTYAAFREGGSRADVRSYFDDRARRYEERSSSGPVGLLRRRERSVAFEMLDPQSGESILDAGCGSGFAAVPLSEMGCRVFGVDLSPEMVRAVQARGIEAQVADIEGLDLGRRFDKVLSFGALEFCRSPALALSSLARHLAPGGSLVLVVPMRRPLGIAYRLFHASHGLDVHVFSREEIEELLVRAGFAVPRFVEAGPVSDVVCARKKAPQSEGAKTP